MRGNLNLSRLQMTLVLFGVVFLFIGFKDLYYDTRTPGDFNSMLESDIQKGMIVEGDVYANLGAFEENYTTRNGVKTGRSKYNYMIPVGETQYMGLLNNTSTLETELESQANATYYYMMGESETEPQPVHFKGRVVKMTDETKGYMRDYMLDLGFTADEVDSYILPYYIKCEIYDAWGWLLIIGFICLAIGLATIIVPIMTARRKSQAMFANESSVNYSQNYGVIEDDFDTFQASTDNAYNNVMNDTQTAATVQEEYTSYKSAFDEADLSSGGTSTSGLGMGVADEFAAKEEKTKPGLSLKLKD